MPAPAPHTPLLAHVPHEAETSLVPHSRPGSKTSASIEAEMCWSIFVAKHGLSFLFSDHATKLFPVMFPDSKSFACGCTKTTAIVKEVLAPYFIHRQAVANMSKPFSIMMDDKTDKSCIILVRVFDSESEDAQTHFLDMPIVNIGTASNLFTAVKSSLSKHDLDFANTLV